VYVTIYTVKAQFKVLTCHLVAFAEAHRSSGAAAVATMMVSSPHARSLRMNGILQQWHSSIPFGKTQGVN
jgi:hypothetical protein